MKVIKIIAVIYFVSIVFSRSSAIAQKFLTEGERMKERANVENKIKVPTGVDKEIYISYLVHFGREFEYYNVEYRAARARLKTYFGDTAYRAITNWDIDGDGLEDYFAVETYRGIHRGVKRALIVNKKGEDILYIDTVKGIYTPDYMIIDLKKIGYMKEEVGCYSIGFIPYVKGENNTFGHGNGSFDIQILDKELYVVGTGYTDKNASYRRTDTIFLVKYDKEKKRYLFDPDIPPPSNRKDYLRETLQIYREAKKQRKVYIQPKKINEVDIELAIKWWLL